MDGDETRRMHAFQRILGHSAVHASTENVTLTIIGVLFLFHAISLCTV